LGSRGLEHSQLLSTPVNSDTNIPLEHYGAGADRTTFHAARYRRRRRYHRSRSRRRRRSILHVIVLFLTTNPGAKGRLVTTASHKVLVVVVVVVVTSDGGGGGARARARARARASGRRCQRRTVPTKVSACQSTREDGTTVALDRLEVGGEEGAAGGEGDAIDCQYLRCKV
jgi:hypothetical protein